MPILEVNSNNIETLNSVLYYCYSLLNGCNNIELGSTSNNGKPFFKISEGEYLIEFKSEQIEIIYKVYKNHPPLDFTPNYNYYSDIKIIINDIQIGEEFIEASVIFYKNEILRERFGKIPYLSNMNYDKIKVDLDDSQKNFVRDVKLPELVAIKSIDLKDSK